MKDYAKIKEEIKRLGKTKRLGEIKTKDILNLGLTYNDIKIFVEKRIIAPVARGTYVLDINAIDPVIPSLMEEKKEQQAELPKTDEDSEPITQPEQIIKKQEVPQTSQKTNQETSKEKSNDTYLCYQENIRMAKFNEASLNLANYEHQLNSSNNQRNLKYLHDRIEFYKKEYHQNPDQYAQKQSLIVDIYESLAKNEYDRCLELIENYLNLSSLRNPEILSIKAYILVSLNRYEEAEKIVDHLMSEEPRYYYVKALINFKHQRYEACLRNCVKYNERRPRENVTIYTLMAESYRKEKHNKRAIKCQEMAIKLQTEEEIPLLEYIVEPINLKPDQELSKQLKKFNN